ncbi:hypothetical protein FUAX_08950 [Fulvitalea axinellae]|uniref:Uncharacterized protein n=1 Tax=Fulvitalea axinellae TaxID=1182444 RepID=A0AAU9CKD5_9BACT|nr:hypothetical protein FUAX_08950 [Fulvitalea axinellae]
MAMALRLTIGFLVCVFVVRGLDWMVGGLMEYPWHTALFTAAVTSVVIWRQLQNQLA